MCSLATAAITSLRRRPLKGPCMSDSKNSGWLKWIELVVRREGIPLVLVRVVIPGNGEVGREIHLEPGILADLGDGDALHRVVHEHLRNQVATALRKEVGEAVEAV